MCLCGLEKTQFRNELKSSINAGRYTADYLSCGNLPYPAREMCMTAHLSYRRIRRYLVWRLKRPEARDFSRVRIELLIHCAHNEISILQYNNENSLSCTIHLAFYFAREYYTIIRELPTGKGFADVCFIPRKIAVWSKGLKSKKKVILTLFTKIVIILNVRIITILFCNKRKQGRNVKHGHIIALSDNG